MFELQNYSIGPMIQCLKLVGIYPIHSKNPILNTLQVFWGYFLYTWYIIFTTTEFIEMYFIWGNLQDMTTNATVSFLYIVGLAKVYILICMKPRLHKMIRIIFELEDAVLLRKDEDIELYQIFQAYCQRSNWINYFMKTMTFITILACFFIPHTEMYLSGPTYVKFENGSLSDVVRKPLVFSSWFPFDSNGDVGYFVAFGLQVISGCIGASFLVFSDLFIVGSMIFVVGQLQLIQSKFKNLGRSKCYKVIGRHREVKIELSGCIKHHIEIIKYAKNLREWFNPVMFMDFLVCSVMLCAIGYQATEQEFSIRLFFVVEYLCAMLTQLFLFYWFANEVLEESLKVAKSAWESNWYTFDIKSRKTLSFVIMRSQRPLTFKAGPFNDMSLVTYLGILKASYTYLTLLRQVEGS